MRTRLGIAGVGLIGASIGLRAAAHGAVVAGFDRDPAALAVALERGAISIVAKSFAELAESCDVLVLGGPLEATLAQIAQLATLPARAATVFDVASVKTPVALASRGLAGFVATHPIAGSEQSGPGAARADLFEGRTWTVDPSAQSASLGIVTALIAEMGASSIKIESLEHDRTIALTSHLPQIVSVALGAQLAERLDDPETRELCGTGIRSMLRLGGSSWPVWRAVLAANSVSIAQEVRRLAAILSDAADALEAHQVDELEIRFTSASLAVTRLGEAATNRKADI